MKYWTEQVPMPRWMIVVCCVIAHLGAKSLEVGMDWLAR